VTNRVRYTHIIYEDDNDDDIDNNEVAELRACAVE